METSYSKNLFQRVVSNLASISEESVSEIMKIAKERVIKKGTVLLSPYEVCQDLYFIEEGLLQQYAIRETEIINYYFLTEGNFYCDIKSLKSQQPTAFYLKSLEQTRVLTFDAQQLSDLALANPEVKEFTIRVAANLEMVMSEELKIARLSNIEKYQFLLKNRSAWVQRLSITQLASYIGVARETLSRLRANA